VKQKQSGSAIIDSYRLAGICILYLGPAMPAAPCMQKLLKHAAFAAYAMGRSSS
jgi:hypothetical protein